ncbi:TIGR03857 family LLM class F420-dependent oxidoreductase [Skermania piniformis]|uniref:TIGR03857 family LLM class F420-dependent oxidoreductase n=1 Tax=Skermania pinensis TaxID=39122 RepID=A0ABX8SAM4_9ACTN|nr:TIGR03857 family LLM class F420-dependent oxidoreductase [Skermania piniformis]QXQ14044.1 TIGR03857 family LLM class F420-dependent oxidoreductase [Skermania piniformis]
MATHPGRPAYPELGCYGLAGHTDRPGDLIGEVRRAEELGLGAIFLSERFNYKDAAVLSGMAAAAGTTLGIATAATNHNTRHPLVTATMAATMHRATGGRFALGLGRGFAPLFDLMGVPPITNAQLADAFAVLRRLWAGEKFAHSGPIGDYPFLMPLGDLAETIPLLMVAIGPKSQALAGRIADAVVLHTYLTDEAVARAVAIIREAAEQAGRDPATVRIWACTAVVDDALDEPTRLRMTVGRLATYLQGYGDTLVAANRWDPELLRRFRADPFVSGFGGAFDAVGTVDDLARLTATVLPAEWLGAAITGSAADCARQIDHQFAATGVDSIIMHGVTPDQLAGVVAGYAAVRSAGHDRLPANPGWTR